MAQDDVAVVITPVVDEGGTLFTRIKVVTCDMIRGGTYLFKKGTRYILGKFLGDLRNIFVSEIGRVIQVWFLNKFNELVNDMSINVFNGLITEEDANFNLRYIDTVFNHDDIIPMGISLQNKIVNITSNGTMNVEPDFGYQGLGEVEINTNVPSSNLQLYKSVSINQNKLTVIEPDQGYNGIRQVQVTTNIPSDINNQSKNVSIDSNGYLQVVPDQGYSGISELNLNVDVPQPSIEDNITLFVEAGKEARQVIVEPSQGFDALEQVTLNVGRPTLARDQNILNITNNGTYNLPSVADSVVLGFADSCTVTVNVPNGRHVIDRVAVGYHTSPTGGSYEGVDVNLSEFERVSGNSFNASQQYGYLIIYNSNGIISIGFVVPNDNNGVTINATVSEVYYYELGPAKYVRLMNFYDGNEFVGEVISNNVVLGSQIVSRFRRDIMSCTLFET